MKAEGGGDEPEALLDGLYLATQLKWIREYDKYLFIIGDSPPHGKLFHDGTCFDEWPDNNEPCGLNIVDIIKNLKGIEGKAL